jgi:hypothetical protein
MLGAAASVVLVSGGAGFLGPLGSVISGHGARSATEAAAVTGAPGGSTPIVAFPSSTLAASRGGASLPGRSRRGGGAPGGRRTRGGGSPSIGLPGRLGGGGAGGGGGGGGSGSGPGNGGPGGPSRPPSTVADTVDTAGNTVEQAGRQAPALQPITDPIGRLTHQIADTCRSLPACP